MVKRPTGADVPGAAKRSTARPAVPAMAPKPSTAERDRPVSGTLLRPSRMQEAHCVPNDAPVALGSLARDLERAAATIKALETTDLGDKEELQRRQLLTSLALIRAKSSAMARFLAVEGIEEGEISRVQVSKILGVHQATVARWLKEDEETEIPEELTPEAEPAKPGSIPGRPNEVLFRAPS